MKKLQVSTHAAIRMCERGFHVDNPTPKQIKHAENIIKESLLNKNMEVLLKAEEGSFYLEDYGVYALVRNMKVRTVASKGTEETYARVSGGVKNSGRKIKKWKLSTSWKDKKNLEKRVN